MRYWKPKVETIPVRKPIHIVPPGCIIMPADAPITTPPAKVAFSICSIVNFSLTKALVAKVPRQLPVREIMVLPMICVFVKGVVENAPKLKDGQYIQRNSVPIKANRFE